MDDRYLQRFSRHILLDDIGVEGQERIAKSSIAIVGMGGLGCPAALNLVLAGAGQVTLIDADTVDLTNLQRQYLYTPDVVGINKAEAAYQSLLSYQSPTQIQTQTVRVSAENVHEVLGNSDIILDCSDNFRTRFLLNSYCHQHQKVLVSGAAIQFDGHLISFDFRAADTPCYACIYDEDAEVEEDLRCATTGIFSPVTAIIGNLQAAEALKAAVGIQAGDTKQIRYNGLSGQFKQTMLIKDPGCTVCSQ